MRIALLAGGDGWHVRDLQRAAAAMGHEALVIDFRKVSASVALDVQPLAGFDGVVVRTMPPGSLEQVVFRMDLLHRLAARGIPVRNSRAPLAACIANYLARARLHASRCAYRATSALP